MTTRDRDESGRPRNARPRDALGRPMPHDTDGVERVPDDVALPPAESLAEAQRLIDAGRAFNAHEVLEGTWKAAPEPERELWRGLAQLAVGITHAQRGNTPGAVGLLQRAADRIEPYAANPPYNIAAGPLVTWARTLATQITTSGLPALTPADLIPRLRTGPAGEDGGRGRLGPGEEG